MNDRAYSFEIKDLMTQFVAAFDDVVIKRFNQSREAVSSVQVRYLYSPKERVLYDIVNRAQNVTLPVIAVSIGNVTRDNDRVFNKIGGFYYSQSTTETDRGNFSTYFRTPVPINVTVNMSIIAKYQSDMDQILSNFVPYNDPYIIISWQMPKALELKLPQEIRSEVLWDGNIAMKYPTDINATDKYRVTADTSFTIKGWLFKEIKDLKAANIFTINNNFYAENIITDYELMTGRWTPQPTPTPSGFNYQSYEVTSISNNSINLTANDNIFIKIDNDLIEYAYLNITTETLTLSAPLVGDALIYTALSGILHLSGVGDSLVYQTSLGYYGISFQRLGSVELFTTKQDSLESVNYILCSFKNFIPTPTPTVSPTNTTTPSVTPTHTPTNSGTPRATPTNTITPTNTFTLTPTNTISGTPRQTKTPTKTPTCTPTVTPTITPTNTPTFNPSPTATETPTNTPTASNTPTPTVTETPTNTPTVTETPTNTPTSTVTPTPTVTTGLTPTPTSDPTPTPTGTPDPTPTPTGTPDPTPTPTGTPDPTTTPTETPPVTETPTGTPVPTPPLTPTQTRTHTPTPTQTPTNTNTPTNTLTPTSTLTNTPTNTPTVTKTPTNTPTTTNTPTNTPTQTPSKTPYAKIMQSSRTQPLTLNDFIVSSIPTLLSGSDYFIVSDSLYLNNFSPNVSSLTFLDNHNRSINLFRANQLVNSLNLIDLKASSNTYTVLSFNGLSSLQYMDIHNCRLTQSQIDNLFRDLANIAVNNVIERGNFIYYGNNAGRSTASNTWFNTLTDYSWEFNPLDPGGANITIQNSPTPTPTPSPTKGTIPTETPTATPTRTPSHTPTNSVTPTETLVNSPTPTASITATPSYTPSRTPEISPTPTNTITPSFTPSNTPTISLTPSFTPTPTFTPSNPAIQSLLGVGSNAFGQLATSDNILINKFTPISGTWDKIVIGKEHTFALSGNKWFACGSNYYGQLGFGDQIDRFEFTLLSGNWEKIVCGDWYTFALSGGKWFSTGYNGSGQLGINSLTDSLFFTQISGDFNFKEIYCGGNFTLGLSGISNLLSGNKWYVTGSNQAGQLNINNNRTDIQMFTAVPLPWVVNALSCGEDFIVALSSNNRWYAVGENVLGQLGAPQSTTTSRTDWRAISISATNVVPGDSFSLALSANTPNGLLAWFGVGYGRDGSLGVTTSAAFISGYRPIVGKWDKVIAGSNFSYALSSNKWYGTGYNVNGQLGLGHFNSIVGFKEIGAFDQIITKGNRTFALSSGQWYGAGSNHKGQLGIGVNNVINKFKTL